MFFIKKLYFFDNLEINRINKLKEVYRIYIKLKL